MSLKIEPHNNKTRLCHFRKTKGPTTCESASVVNMSELSLTWSQDIDNKFSHDLAGKYHSHRQ